MTATAQPPEPSELPHEVLEQAAHWFATLDSGEATETDRQRWRSWLAAAAEHRAAWHYVERISRRFEPIKASAERETAISAYQQASGARLHRRRTLLGLAVLAGGGLSGWAVWRHSPLPGAAVGWLADHRTGTGEVREVVLADGSKVWLNAGSAFDLDFQPGTRRLVLLRGEILVDTAADPRRPFYVETPQGSLQALGTRFAVRLEPAGTLVAVYEGAVEMRAAVSGASAIVPAGRQARFSRTALEPAGIADPAREAWSRGLLLARDIPLLEVVQELRRHHHGHLGLAPELEGLRVFGGYPIHDPDRALAMLESVLPIRVRRSLPWWTSIEPRAEAATGR